MNWRNEEGKFTSLTLNLVRSGVLASVHPRPSDRDSA